MKMRKMRKSKKSEKLSYRIQNKRFNDLCFSQEKARLKLIRAYFEMICLGEFLLV